MSNLDPKTSLGNDARPRQSCGQIDLNSASEAEIAEIEMVGKKIAHAIVQLRTQQGGFRDWSELKQVAGLDPQRLAELQRAARI